MIRWNDSSGPGKPSITDPYDTLGVSRRLGLGEIRSAYLQLVRLFHPDHRHPFMKAVAEERLKVITAAWKAIRMEREHGK